MEIVSDLHLHSRFAMACSKQITLKKLEEWARVKGLNLLGTADFAHPKWIQELKQELVKEENGIYYTKTGFPFIMQMEISLIYTDGGKGRRVHIVILAPSMEVVDQITEYLLTKGRVDYDGRPIFKIPCDQLVEDLRKISEDIEMFPAHAWTPWFSIFGSKSGFDTVEEAFKDQTKHVHAIETGMSSDPAMNWRISKLDKFNLVSFSDSHSFWPWRLGRETTNFEIKELSYNNIIKAIRTGEGLKETIETDPNYGRYHYDGHRKCGVVLSPAESRKLKGLCPKCGRPLTIGVEYRVEELADRPLGFVKKNAKPFKKLIPLSEILSLMLGQAIATKKVWDEYNKLIREFKSEFNILLNVPLEDLKKLTHERIAETIIKNREQKIKVKPGYDGVYGEPMLEGETPKEEIKPLHEQKGLGDYF
jgi:uncharacterized protein (TIGR00375 family)